MNKPKIVSINLLKRLIGVSIILFSMSALAVDVQQPILNKVSYQLSEEQWVTTSTVKVTVSLDATLDKGNFELCRV